MSRKDISGTKVRGKILIPTPKGGNTMNDTFEKISDIIGRRFELSETKITPETTWEEIGADSIDLVDLISEIEDDFDVSIPDDSIEDLKTVGDVVALVDEL